MIIILKHNLFVKPFEIKFEIYLFHLILLIDLGVSMVR